ncbi:hypothetical protein V8C86DRAFT_25281 [Haematococcus lacustris]
MHLTAPWQRAQTLVLLACALRLCSGYETETSLMLQSARLSAIADPSTDCQPDIQQLSLSTFYSATGGPWWTNQANWNQAGISCRYPGLNVTLPAHCCWYGVQCCMSKTCPEGVQDRTLCDCSALGLVTSITLSRNNLTGVLPAWVLVMQSCELRRLDLTFNRLRGTISDDVAKLGQLRYLSLGYNSLTGTIPSMLGNLNNLAVLDLTANQLVGNVPPNLCRNQVSALTDILIANNHLNGSLNIQLCAALVLLDAASNDFSGPLPSFRGYYQLHIARLGNNSFNMNIPDTIAAAPLLTDLDVSYNK